MSDEEPRVHYVKSFADAFDKEFRELLKSLPDFAAEVETQAAEGAERYRVQLSDTDLQLLQIKMLFFMRTWITNLAREVDRLAEALDEQGTTGKDD